MLAFRWPSDLQVNHMDWNKLNNNLDNLEYCTASENIRHSFLNLNRKISPYIWIPLFWKDNWNAKKINQLTIDWIFIKSFNCIIDASREFNIDNSSITKVCKGKQKTAWWYNWEYKI